MDSRLRGNDNCFIFVILVKTGTLNTMQSIVYEK